MKLHNKILHDYHLSIHTHLNVQFVECQLVGNFLVRVCSTGQILVFSSMSHVDHDFDKLKSTIFEVAFNKDIAA